MDTTEHLDKKQRRDHEQNERMRTAKRESQKQLLKRIGLWGGIALALALMVWGLAKLGSTNDQAQGATLSDPVTDADWIRGNKTASTTLVEYSDFQCPACGAAEPAVENIFNKYSAGGKLRLVYRHFPLSALHPNALVAAQAAEAAGNQGKFWEMHDMLFENQTTWAPLPNPLDTFVSYATKLGLNTLQFTTDFNSSVVLNKINAHIAGGDRSSVNATPTFFLNGKQLVIQSSDDFQTAIDAAMKGAK